MNMMKKIRRFVAIAVLLTVVTACGEKSGDDPQPDPGQTIYHPDVNDILNRINNADGQDVIVAVHRGTYANAPENSLSGIQKCIDYGVDMVELDVRRTKDGYLVLMHDASIDRTTSGKGNVSDLTLEEISKYFLRSPDGLLTREKVPTLEEALGLVKGKIMVRIDKSYSILNAVIIVLQQTGTLRQASFIIPKENDITKVKKDWGEYLDDAYLTPTLEADYNTMLKAAEDYQEGSMSMAFEMSFTYDTTPALSQFSSIRQRGSRIMVYTGTASTCGGHDDIAAETNPEFAYGWLIAKDVNIIQTGRPDLLLPYLREKKLHE